MRFPTMWYEWAKAQTSLGIGAVWSVFASRLNINSMTVELLAEQHSTVSKLQRRLYRLVWVYTCQLENATLLDINVMVQIWPVVTEIYSSGQTDRIMSGKLCKRHLRAHVWWAEFWQHLKTNTSSKRPTVLEQMQQTTSRSKSIERSA